MIPAFPEVAVEALGVSVVTSGNVGGPMEDMRASRGVPVDWDEVMQRYKRRTAEPLVFWYTENCPCRYHCKCPVEKQVLVRVDYIELAPVSWDDYRHGITYTSGRSVHRERGGPSPFFEYIGPPVQFGKFEDHVIALRKRAKEVVAVLRNMPDGCTDEVHKWMSAKDSYFTKEQNFTFVKEMITRGYPVHYMETFVKAFKGFDTKASESSSTE
jgi:hypothetical protein